MKVRREGVSRGTLEPSLYEQVRRGGRDRSRRIVCALTVEGKIWAIIKISHCGIE